MAQADSLRSEITRLYRRKAALLADYREMARAQAGMLADGAVEKVEAVLSAKDRKIREINAVDVAIGSIARETLSLTGTADLAALLASPGWEEVKEVRGHIDALLAGIKTLEDANHAVLQRLSEELAAEIRAMRTQKTAAQTYRPGSTSADSTYLDKRK